MRITKITKFKLFLVSLAAMSSMLAPVAVASAQEWCGKPNNPSSTQVTLNIGCRHKGNGIIDALFAIIRFLSTGVGIVVVGSVIVAGIQYSVSMGDPQATANAIKRIRSSVVALIIFIFVYPILNFLIPSGFFK